MGDIVWEQVYEGINANNSFYDAESGHQTFGVLRGFNGLV